MMQQIAQWFKTFFQPRQDGLQFGHLAGMAVLCIAFIGAFFFAYPKIGVQAASFAYVFLALLTWFYGLSWGMIGVLFCSAAIGLTFRQMMGPQVFVGTGLFVFIVLAVSGIRSLYVRMKLAEARLREEHEKSELILLNIFPKKIVERLKSGEVLIADRYEETTILFSDLVGFTDLTKIMTPNDLVMLLDKIVTGFDKLSEKHGIEKIKTIGDAYLVVSGLPEKNQNHALAVCRMALSMQDFLRDFNRAEKTNLQIRIGIHSGDVIGGIIGPKKFNFDLWGDTVNLASRLESAGIPGKIQVSRETYLRTKDYFRFEPREHIEIKGHGTINTFFLVGPK